MNFTKILPIIRKAEVKPPMSLRHSAKEKTFL